ncbi:MAG: Mth938-like domain-containing protein [Burkholderiales bacterium]|nr:Mth938-like domain-containing protein [Burkholderiales bacterium]
MKLHLADTRNSHTFTAYGSGYLSVNGTRYEHSLLVFTDQPPRAWPVGDFSSLSAGDAAHLLENRPEIIIFGTGPGHLLPGPELLSALAGAGTGFEIMSTAAACRTFNILAGEGRRVIAAMWLP